MVGADTIAGEKPSQLVQANEIMLKQFQAVEPEFKGRIQPEESVRKSLQVIARLDAESSGFLLSHNGNKTRWL
jgi:hypothetical protein